MRPPAVVVIALPAACREYVGDSLSGGLTGAEKRVMAKSCDGQIDDVTMEFARLAGRIDWTGSGVERTSSGCHVPLLIPRGAGPDPMDAIDKAVGPHGWERTEEATWVRADGFKVRARQPEPDDPMVSEHWLNLWGSFDE